MARVKARRSYDSTARRARAEHAREAVIDAAEKLFFSDGYAQTTVARIASAGGVSVEMIYKTFGGKPGIVRAIRDRGLAGLGPVPAEERSDQMRRSEPDPRKIIARWSELSMEVAPRVSPILLLVRDAAAADPAMAALRSEMDADRLRRMKTNARGLHEAGHLRPDLTLQQAADVLWTYSSPELYELLVARRGWSLERYARFLAEGMIAALLPPLPQKMP